jgi:hypothetical protein
MTSVFDMNLLYHIFTVSGTVMGKCKIHIIYFCAVHVENKHYNVQTHKLVISKYFYFEMLAL